MAKKLMTSIDHEQRGVRVILSVACGGLIACLNYGQPLATEIASDINLSTGNLGLIATLPYAGYGIGLLLLVPLADLFENKIIVITAMSLVIISVLLLFLLPAAIPFLIVSLLMGVMASVVQVLVPYGTFLVSPALQGRVVAESVTGIMLGVLLSRPVAGWLSDVWGWRSVYLFAGCTLLIVSVPLMLFLPKRKPTGGFSYGQLLSSMSRIFLQTPVLRRKAFYQACMFGTFSMFWTSVPMLLKSSFQLSNNQIAWVSMAGVAGVIAPPFATRLVDRGNSRIGTIYAFLIVLVAFLIAAFSNEKGVNGIVMIIIAAILLGLGTISTQVIGQRAIYALDESQRARLNGLFTAIFFLGGAVGAGISSMVFSHFGWVGINVTGFFLTLMAFLYSLTEPKENLSSTISTG
jgi:predicted MFS family arabinose efflux permease